MSGSGKRLQFNWLGVISLVIFMFFFVGGHKITGIIYHTVGDSDYRIFQQEKNVFSKPTKIIASDKELVVFYEDSGYAAFYSLDGEFKYGIQVDNSDKGTGNIAFIDELCYIISKNNTLYCFDGSTLIESFKITIYSDREWETAIRQQMGSRDSLECESGNNTYRLSSSKGSVEKTDRFGGSITVVKLPGHDMATFLVLIGMCIFAAFILKEAFFGNAHSTSRND